MVTTDLSKRLVVAGCEGKRLVSNSSRSDFTFCPRYFWMRRVVGVKPRQEPRPLAVGNLIHTFLRRLYSGLPADAVLASVDEWRNEQVMVAESLETPMYSVADIHERADLAMVILTRYVERYWKTDSERYETLAVEAPFVVPIGQPYTVNGETKMRTDALYAYTGVFDIVVRERQTNQVLIVDHKTTVATDLQSFESYIRDAGKGQRVGYVYAARYFWDGVAGIDYNVIRKKAPSEVPTNQCPKCKGAGCDTCWGTGIKAISKKVPDTTAELYAASVDEIRRRNPALDTTVCDDVLAELRSRGDRFFYRFTSPVTEAEIQRWAVDFYHVCHAMGSAADDESAYRNLGACDVNNRKCSHLRVCDHGWEGNHNFEVQTPDSVWLPFEASDEDDGASSAGK